MGYMNTQNNQFNSAEPAAPTRSAGSQSQAISARSASQFTVTADIPATKLEAALGPSTNV
jgi:hypothetical protein